MPFRNHASILPVLAGAFLLAILFLLWPAQEASAQCGSQASSCKNCHEVQGQDPVNSDGTGWHVSHAFGDFCYICHAGNNQSLDIDEAHTGMVPPLSDVNAACQQCHPADLTERAAVYATALGVEIGTGGGPSAAAPGADGDSPPTQSDVALPAAQAVVVNQVDIVDYVQRYDESVLGKRIINWGDAIVGTLIVLVIAGGGGFVYYNERKLRNLPLFRKGERKIKEDLHTEKLVPGLDQYAPEVLALIPSIAKLTPSGLIALERLLKKPDEASDLLLSLSRLDPELVRSLRSLDQESRALLFALSGR